MSPNYLGFVAILAIAQLILPKRYAFLPLIIAGLHLGNMEILPELTPGRMIIALGLVRAASGRFLVFSPKTCRLDVWFLFFALFSISSTVGHKADEYVPSPFFFRVGFVLNCVGCYLYGRAYLSDIASFRRYALLLPLILIPLAACMTYEQRNGRNLYFMLGAASETTLTREGKVRAAGPFRHPILAGCSGATALSFVVLVWRSGNRTIAMAGLVGCLGVVLACASSGPLAAVAMIVLSMIFWRWRGYMRHAIWAGLFVAVLYSLYTGRGPWYLMASMDLVGGSTGWHRANLIDMGFTYLDEWWLWGSDYTRHWMASGIRWNPNHIDITNYYLHLGIMGGLPLALCLIGILVTSFKLLSRRMTELHAASDQDEFALWCVATSLAAHAVSFVSISYFDQMYIYFYLLLGAIPGLVATAGSNSNPAPSASKPVELEAAPAYPLRYYS
jgi:hypothetical protein